MTRATAQRSITILGLGYNNYGFSSSHEVALYNSGGSEIADAIVTGSSTIG